PTARRCGRRSPISKRPASRCIRLRCAPMKRSVVLRTSRLLQLAGLVLAVAGLLGFWWPREPERMTRTVLQEGLLNPAGEDFQVSFAVAGRDMDATGFASACRWE